MTALRSPEPISLPGLPAADAGFQRIYARHEPALLAYCRGILRDEHDARDALQNTALRALVALRGGDHLLNERAWLFRIAHNESISLLRARRFAAELDSDALSGGAEPEAAALLREHVNEVMQDLNALAPRARQALWLREVLGLGYDEIARVLGVREGAVRQAVSEARAALRADRSAREEDCEVVRVVLTLADGRRRRGRVARAHMRGCAACRAWRDEERRPAGRGRLLLFPAAALRWAAELLRSNAVEGLVSGRLAPRGAGALAGLAVGAVALGATVDHSHRAVRHPVVPPATHSSAPVRGGVRMGLGGGVKVSSGATRSIVRTRAAAPVAVVPAAAATLSAPRKTAVSATRSGFSVSGTGNSDPVGEDGTSEPTSAPERAPQHAADHSSPSSAPNATPNADPTPRDTNQHQFAPQQHYSEPPTTNDPSPLPQTKPDQDHNWAPRQTRWTDGGGQTSGHQLTPDSQTPPAS